MYSRRSALYCFHGLKPVWVFASMLVRDDSSQRNIHDVVMTGCS